MKGIIAILAGGAALWAAGETIAPLGTYKPLERKYWAFQPRRTSTPPAFPDAGRQSLGQDAGRCIHPRRAQESRPEACAAASRSRDADPPRHLRSHGSAADARRDRRLRARQVAQGWEKVVDRLLDSPHYGEQWGRHWLDVVRFAESDGYEYDTHRPDAYRYRDYVVHSFNDDKPYDEFVKEQLAGDEMDADSNDDAI